MDSFIQGDALIHYKRKGLTWCYITLDLIELDSICHLPQREGAPEKSQMHGIGV